VSGDRAGAGASVLVADVTVERPDFAVTAALRAEPGRPVALLGPNGAGKSTILGALAGLVPVDAGAVRLGDAVLDDVAAGVHVAAERRRVGYVFQEFLLFPHLTVRDNVAFAVRVGGLSRAAARVATEPLLARFGLDALADRHPGSLSGGQQQRVALARALAADPVLLLLDEPMAALDVEVRDEVRAGLAAELRGVGVPTVLVTHDAADVAALAAEVVVVERGAVTQRGTLDALRAAPATPYVARL
jgi:ABC-type sulfate/molybdate transport systems ATPase subunit